ncbi:MAG: Flp pilus assembly protein CpaB [Clostridia bacterium]
MNKIIKNRAVLGCICIVMAFLICFAITPIYNNALQSTTEIVRLNQDISKGSLITSKMVSTVEVGAYNLPSNLIYNESEIVGKYANADLFKDDYVLKSKLSDVSTLKNDYLNALDGTNRAISFSIQFFAGGLSGKLEQGDIISIIASDYGEYRETLTPTELQYVEVIATTSGDGFDYNTQTGSSDMASTITVLVSPEQAEIIAKLEQESKIHVALVYRGDEQTAQLFLDEQARVIGEIK